MNLFHQLANQLKKSEVPKAEEKKSEAEVPNAEEKKSEADVPNAEEKKSEADVPKAEENKSEALKCKNDVAVRITSLRNKTHEHRQKLTEDYSKNFIFQTDSLLEERQRIIDRLKIIREKSIRSAGKESASSKLPAKQEKSQSEMTLEAKKINPPSSSTLPKQDVTPSGIEVISEIEKPSSSNSPIMPEKTNTEDNPSSNSPAKRKVTRSSTIPQKVVTVKTQKTGLKRKANVSALTANKKIRKEILYIDLTCEDVDEYFPEKIKINLGHRCDSPAFRLGSIKNCVPSTDHGSKVPVKRSSCSTDEAKADSKTSINKERGSYLREPLRQLLSSDRNKSSSEFKMIRVDYKKNAEQK